MSDGRLWTGTIVSIGGIVVGLGVVAAEGPTWVIAVAAFVTLCGSWILIKT